MSRRDKLKTASAALVMAVALVGSSTACYKHTIIAGTGAPSGRLVSDHWQNFWIAGLIGHTTVDLKELCPSGNATIEAKQTFLNGLVSALTSGIYTPTTVRVRCEDGRTGALALDSDDVRRIVADDRFRTWVGADAPEMLTAVVRAQSHTSTH